MTESSSVVLRRSSFAVVLCPNPKSLVHAVIRDYNFAFGRVEQLHQVALCLVRDGDYPVCASHGRWHAFAQESSQLRLGTFRYDQERQVMHGNNIGTAHVRRRDEIG